MDFFFSAGRFPPKGAVLLTSLQLCDFRLPGRILFFFCTFKMQYEAQQKKKNRKRNNNTVCVITQHRVTDMENSVSEGKHQTATVYNRTTHA
jgi:hypothetical protein